MISFVMFKPRQDKPAGVIAIGYRAFWSLDGFDGDPGVAQIPGCEYCTGDCLRNLLCCYIKLLCQGCFLGLQQRGVAVAGAVIVPTEGHHNIRIFFVNGSPILLQHFGKGFFADHIDTVFQGCAHLFAAGHCAIDQVVSAF